MILAAFLCTVASVTDADTFRCVDGTRIRLAGVEANERKGGCHLPVCPKLPHAQAKPIAERLILGKTLRCVQVGTSYRRIVASCSLGRLDIRCALIRTGAVVDWVEYSRRYRLGGCRG